MACAPAPAPAGAPEATAPAPKIRPWCIQAEKNCGFGSVHYLRDIGDAAKVSEAVSIKEADGQETCSDPVVIVGGGILTMELAAKIARFRGQKVPVTVILSRDRIMPKVFREDIAPEAGSLGAKDVAEFYERQLVKCGVKFIREHRCLRLWDVEECGEFPTMEGPAISLQELDLDGLKLSKASIFRRVGVSWWRTTIVKKGRGSRRSASFCVWEMSPTPRCSHS